jgi:hypothetical protein
MLSVCFAIFFCLYAIGYIGLFFANLQIWKIVESLPNNFLLGFFYNIPYLIVSPSQKSPLSQVFWNQQAPRPTVARIAIPRQWRFASESEKKGKEKELIESHRIFHALATRGEKKSGGQKVCSCIFFVRTYIHVCVCCAAAKAASAAVYVYYVPTILSTCIEGEEPSLIPRASASVMHSTDVLTSSFIDFAPAAALCPGDR